MYGVCVDGTIHNFLLKPIFVARGLKKGSDPIVMDLEDRFLDEMLCLVHKANNKKYKQKFPIQSHCLLFDQTKYSILQSRKAVKLFKCCLLQRTKQNFQIHTTIKKIIA